MAEMQLHATSTSDPVTFSVGETKVVVTPVWCSRSEEVKLDVSFIGYGVNQATARWDGSSIVWTSKPECPVREL